MAKTIKHQANTPKKKRWVIKVGSSVLAADDGSLKIERLQAIAKQVAALKQRGDEVIVVSSGAVASGFRKLGFSKPPKIVPERQACASVGQSFLVRAYSDVFEQYDTTTGLVLLTHDDLDNRKRYLNARNTLTALLQRGSIPLINENDAVAVEEILLGDNDQLASSVAALMEADCLVLLTVVDGVYDRAPSLPGAQIIPEIDQPQVWLSTMSVEKSQFGSGGMRSKLAAAEKAARFGIKTIIASGLRDGVLLAIADGVALGTTITLPEKTLAARDFWLRFVTKPKGELEVDAGAAVALRQQGKSLLPKGIVAMRGRFSVGDVVLIVDDQKQPLARGLIEYADDELKQIIGKTTHEVSHILGYKRTDEVVHRDNMVLE